MRGWVSPLLPPVHPPCPLLFLGTGARQEHGSPPTKGQDPQRAAAVLESGKCPVVRSGYLWSHFSKSATSLMCLLNLEAAQNPGEGEDTQTGFPLMVLPVGPLMEKWRSKFPKQPLLENAETKDRMQASIGALRECSLLCKVCCSPAPGCIEEPDPLPAFTQTARVWKWDWPLTSHFVISGASLKTLEFCSKYVSLVDSVQLHRLCGSIGVFFFSLENADFY